MINFFLSNTARGGAGRMLSSYHHIHHIIILSYDHIVVPSQPQGANHFWSKVKVKNTKSVFYPFAKDRREKINELQALTFDEESAYDAQKIVAPP